MTISDDVVEQAVQCLRTIEAALGEECGLADPRMKIEIEVDAHLPG